MLEKLKANILFKKLLQRPNINRAYAMVPETDSWYDTIKKVHESLDKISKKPRFRRGFLMGLIVSRVLSSSKLDGQSSIQTLNYSSVQAVNVHPRIRVNSTPCSWQGLPPIGITTYRCELLPHSFHLFLCIAKVVLFLWYFPYVYTRSLLATTISCTARTFL